MAITTSFAIEEMSKSLLPDSNLPFNRQRELTLLSMCIWGEARGEGHNGKLAVGKVVMNRYHSGGFGHTITDIILRPLQFSCFNEKDVNRSKVLAIQNDEVWQECVFVALSVYLGELIDPTNCATHYCHFKATPSWAQVLEQTCQIGNHIFFRGLRNHG